MWEPLEAIRLKDRNIFDLLGFGLIHRIDLIHRSDFSGARSTRRRAHRLYARCGVGVGERIQRKSAN